MELEKAKKLQNVFKSKISIERYKSEEQKMILENIKIDLRITRICY